jgi:hypothetical protein
LKFRTKLMVLTQALSMPKGWVVFR